MRFSLAPVLALVALVAASPIAELEARTCNNNSTNGPNMWCCNNNSKIFGDSKSGYKLVALNALANLQCSSLAQVGSTCSQTVVKCQNMQQNGLINIACVPITV